MLCNGLGMDGRRMLVYLCAFGCISKTDCSDAVLVTRGVVCAVWMGQVWEGIWNICVGDEEESEGMTRTRECLDQCSA